MKNLFKIIFVLFLFVPNLKAKPETRPFIIAVTSESKLHDPVTIEVSVDDKTVISESFHYHLNPVTGTPDRSFPIKIEPGKHTITIKASGESYSFPVDISPFGYYIDMRFADQKSEDYRKDYTDGRILLRSGHFQVVMARPNIIGYD